MTSHPDACQVQNDGASLPTCAPTCPLCGQPNRCAPVAAGSFEVVCWCTSIKIAPEVLKRIPVESRGTACLCAACAAGGASPTPST